MNRRTVISWMDFLFLLVAVVFMFGCVMSAHRSGKVMKPGQVSGGFAYDGLVFQGDGDSDMAHLIAVDGRVGVVSGLDVGLGHTWDITSGNEGAYKTVWGDAKYQFNNHDNELGRPIVSLGVVKGYCYHEDVELHLTSFPVTVSFPISEKMTPYFIYRFERFDEDFFPSEWDDPRHGFFIGNEIVLGDGDGMTPVFGMSIGFMNSLVGGEGDDSVIVLNGGWSFNSPAR